MYHVVPQVLKINSHIFVLDHVWSFWKKKQKTCCLFRSCFVKTINLSKPYLFFGSCFVDHITKPKPHHSFWWSYDFVNDQYVFYLLSNVFYIHYLLEVMIIGFANHLHVLHAVLVLTVISVVFDHPYWLELLFDMISTLDIGLSCYLTFNLELKTSNMSSQYWF